MLRIAALEQWIEVARTQNNAPRYEHVIAKERLDGRAAVLDELRRVFHEAHEDARRALRRSASTSLDPLGAAGGPGDPSAGYPELLALINLQGYTGEIMAGVFAENLPPWQAGEWKVPEFLFRFHKEAFRRLPYFTGIATGSQVRVPGRTGDDCLAFKRDAAGVIVGVLVCEAKCTLDHNMTLIHDAHDQATRARARSVDILALIDILEERADAESASWCEALRALSRSGREETLRTDQITYVCGHSPVQAGRRCWAESDQRSSRYTAARDLQFIELHMTGVEAFIRGIYGPAAGRGGAR